MSIKPATVAAIVVTILVTLFKESCTDVPKFDLEKVLKTLPPAPTSTDTVYLFKYDTITKFRTVVKYKAPEFVDQIGTTDTVMLRDSIFIEPPFAYTEFSDTITELWGSAILTVLSPQEISAYSLEVNPNECPEQINTPHGGEADGYSYVATPISITIPKNFSLGAGPYWNFNENKPNIGLVAGYKGIGANAVFGKNGITNAGLTYSFRW